MYTAVRKNRKGDYNMDFNQIFTYAVECVTKNYANFNGRARRTEYWSFTICSSLISGLISMIYRATGSEVVSILSIIVSLALLVPGIAVAWRRLHDTGRQGAWYFIGLIPVVGWIVLIYWFCQEGVTGENEYGPDPRQAA